MMAKPQLENGYLRIANNLVDALVRTRIAGEANQVLWFIIRKTYGYQKKEDRISLSQFVEATGIRKSHVVRALDKLQTMKLVTKKGNGTVASYSLQKDYDKWKAFPKKGTFPKKGKCVPQKGNKSFPKKGPTKDNKDNSTKDNTADKNVGSMAKEFVSWFAEEWQRVNRAKYSPTWGKHVRLIKPFIRDLGLEEVKARALRFLNDNDAFVAKQGWSIDYFAGKVNAYAKDRRSDNRNIPAGARATPGEYEGIGDIE